MFSLGTRALTGAAAAAARNYWKGAQLTFAGEPKKYYPKFDSTWRPGKGLKRKATSQLAKKFGKWGAKKFQKTIHRIGRTNATKPPTTTRQPMVGRRYHSHAVGRNVTNKRQGGYLNKELKFIDFTFSGAITENIPESEVDHGTNDCLDGVAQGNDEKTRIGRQIWVRQIMIHGQITFENTAADTNVRGNQYVRLWLVLDTQSNAAQAQAEQVLSDHAVSNLQCEAFQNLEHSQRFRVLKKKTIRMPLSNAVFNGTGGESESGEVIVPFALYFKGNVQEHHTGTGATVGSKVDNSFHLICIGAKDAAATLKYVCRMRFTD